MGSAAGRPGRPWEFWHRPRLSSRSATAPGGFTLPSGRSRAPRRGGERLGRFPIWRRRRIRSGRRCGWPSQRQHPKCRHREGLGGRGGSLHLGRGHRRVQRRIGLPVGNQRPHHGDRRFQRHRPCAHVGPVQAMVHSGKIHYFIAGGAGATSGSNAGAITSWVENHFTATTVGGTTSTT